MVKNTAKLYRTLFLHKTNKKMQRKPGMKFFAHSRVWRQLSWIQNFVTWYFHEIWPKPHRNPVQGSFSIKWTKTCHKNRGEVLRSSRLYWLGNVYKICLIFFMPKLFSWICTSIIASFFCDIRMISKHKFPGNFQLFFLVKTIMALRNQ